LELQKMNKEILKKEKGREIDIHEKTLNEIVSNI